MPQTILNRLGLTSAWSVELARAAIGLLAGALLLPVLIYFVGISTLGRYEGASLGGIFRGLYGGLEQGSSASWIVILGPYGLYLLFKALRAWWLAPGTS